ncbi:MAG: hypothetical protein HQ582_03055 [Planctomycetes bacterium]|nr:hypothetical protein [Planctomycetota bacterium]
MNILDSKTVIITGAGASKEYGYPLGSELRQQVASTLRHKPFRPLLQEQGYDESFIDEFDDLLHYSTAHETIDSLLEHHPRFRDIGCLAIAYNLLPKGAHATVFPARGWYRRLFDELALQEDSPRPGNTTILTLNYEQSLQYYLQHAYLYDCSEVHYSLAKKNIGNITYIYAHGTLGEFPKRQLSEQDRGTIAVDAAKRMKIVSDQVDGTEPMRGAAEAIDQANNIVFLGFGYEMETMRRLVGASATSGKNFFGTVLGLPETRRDEVRKYFGNRIVLFDQPIEQWFDEMNYIDGVFPKDGHSSIKFTRHDNNSMIISSTQTKHELLLDNKILNNVISGHFREVVSRHSSNPQDAAILRSVSCKTLVGAANEILDKA